MFLDVVGMSLAPVVEIVGGGKPRLFFLQIILLTFLVEIVRKFIVDVAQNEFHVIIICKIKNWV